MANIFHQSIEDILKTATSEQKILWNDLFLRYGQNISISQFYQSDINSGMSELLTYSARKIYFAYQLDVLGGGGLFANTNDIKIYDVNNVVSRIITHLFTPYYDTAFAGVRYVQNNNTFRNIIFGRLDISTAPQNRFTMIGYRIMI